METPKLQAELEIVAEQIKVRKAHMQELTDLLNVEKIILKQDENKLKALNKAINNAIESAKEAGKVVHQLGNAVREVLKGANP